MATPKNKKSIQNTSGGQRKKTVLFIVLLILMFAAISLPVYLRQQNQKVIAADKTRFEQADKDVQTVAALIKKNVGPPVREESKKWCSRPSVKLGDAPLNCTTQIVMLYGVNNSSEANSLTNKSNAQEKSSWTYIKTETSGGDITTGQFQELEDEFYEPTTSRQLTSKKYFNEKVGINCSISATFYKSSLPPFDDYSLTTDAVSGVAIAIGCSDLAKREHFPLSE